MNEHEQLVDQAARHARSVLFLGGLDAGKSTLARATAAFALRIGRRVAYIDADVAQKTVGPPATVGMKHIREPDDLIPERMSEADALGFVGSISPQDHLVPLVGALGRLRDRARNEGAELLIVDRRRGLRDPRSAREVLQGRRAGARPRGRTPAWRGARADPRR